MAIENAVLGEIQNQNENVIESFDYEELLSRLGEQLDESFADLAFLQEEKELIGSPDALGQVMWSVVREQFISQIAEKAGEDFIKANHGLSLDLRNEAHIQTAENFSEGKIATHNYISKDQLENNYKRYTNTPHKEFREEHVNPGMDATLKRAGELNKQGIDTVTDIYTGNQIPTKTKLENGKNNPDAAQREHVKPSAELYKNPSLQMANSDEELASIINNPENLQGYTTAERNNRKSDKSAAEMDECDKTEHWKEADERAEKYIEQKEQEGENRLKKEGQKTQKEEVFRIGGKALRAVAMQLLAELLNEIVHKLVKWFSSAKRTLEALLDSLKEAILSFISKMKTHLINAGTTVTYTIIAAINDKVLDTVKKAWMFLKQGWHALKNAVEYIRDPQHKSMPIGRLMLETGKIVIAGLTGAGAILLSETIENGLNAVPGFAVDIPYFGSLANIIGIFFGAVVAGIIGALAINLVERAIEKSQKEENIKDQINKGNEILNLQHELQSVSEAKLEQDKETFANSITERHHAAAGIMNVSMTNILENCKEDESIRNDLDDIGRLLAELKED